MGEGHFVEYYFVKNQKVDEKFNHPSITSSKVSIKVITSSKVKLLVL
jgi:hypothetical protein